MASKFTISTVFRGIDRMTKPVRKMTGSIKNMTEKTEAGLRKIDAATSKVTDGLFKVGTTGAKSAAALTAALVVGAGAVNQMKVEQDNMTRAMGLSVTTVESVSSAIKGIGLNAENVTDLAEEMRNKLGEVDPASLGAVTDSFAQMGLNLRDVINLNPQDQFTTITNALLKMEDATMAASAADQIFGSEGNKIISTLRLQGKSMDEIINNYQMLNFRTERSRKGAEEMAKAQSTTAKIIGSLTQEVSGLIGKALTPMITKFNEFMIDNKELISQNLDRLFDSIGNSIGDVSSHMETLLGWIGDLGANFSEFTKWAKWVGMVTLAVTGLMVALKLFIGVMTAVNLVMANPIIAAVVLTVAALAGAAYLVYRNWDGISDWFSNMWESVKTTFNIGLEFIKSMFDWSPVDAVKSRWDGLKDYFSGLFGGIAKMYDNTIGSVMSGIDSISSSVGSVGSFFGFGGNDAEEQPLQVNETVSPQQRMTETISRSIQESKETIKLEVEAANGASVKQAPGYSSNRLSLINTAN